MRMNPGEAFFHPVTHKLVEANGFYQGAAHLDHEVAEEIEEVEGTKEGSRSGKNKSNTNKTSEENK